MALIKFTKTELRSQQVRLGQLQKYLPTLQLKKMMLQLEVNQAQAEIDGLREEFHTAESQVGRYAFLFSDQSAYALFAAVQVSQVAKEYENIAGVDIPRYIDVIFQPAHYSLFDTPVWLEAAVDGLKALVILREKIKITEEKKRALLKELKEVSIRVNLFDKIMIPRALDNIKKIKIFLGDQQLTAVAQAKVAKRKLLERRALL